MTSTADKELVERLRNGDWTDDDLLHAANRLESLLAEVERLQERLKRWEPPITASSGQAQEK